MLNQLARYGPALELVEEARGGGGRLLEVGSGAEGIARFAAPDWEITACDRDFSDYGSVDASAATTGKLTRVEGDVTALPFGDGEFDVVLTLDLLEHVPPELRPKALSELARVASRRVVVACPCGEGALEADRRLARFYRMQGRKPPVWLAEHLENGFPEVAEIASSLEPYGEVRVVPNEGLRMHFAVSAAEGVRGVARGTVWLARRLEPGMRDAAEGRRTRAARALSWLRGGDRDPAYRQFVVVERTP